MIYPYIIKIIAKCQIFFVYFVNNRIIKEGKTIGCFGFIFLLLSNSFLLFSVFFTLSFTTPLCHSPFFYSAIPCFFYSVIPEKLGIHLRNLNTKKEDCHCEEP